MTPRKSSPSHPGGARRANAGAGAASAPKAARGTSKRASGSVAKPGAKPTSRGVGTLARAASGEGRGATQPRAAVRAILDLYDDAARRSRAAGRPVSFHVVVDPSGMATTPPIESPRPSVAAHESRAPADAPDPALGHALDRARARGQHRAAEILAAEDMLSADAFAELLGTSRMTVNVRRQRRQVLALDGAKRGYRFPTWQIDRDGKPFAALPALFDRLGDSAWAVYRFLVQRQDELGGLTGREALERDMSEQAVQVAESVARDFR